MVLMGIAALKEGVTNVRRVVGRNRLALVASFTSRRDTDERYSRHVTAENILGKMYYLKAFVDNFKIFIADTS